MNEIKKALCQTTLGKVVWVLILMWIAGAVYNAVTWLAYVITTIFTARNQNDL